jgi:hypothetical protein
VNSPRNYHHCNFGHGTVCTCKSFNPKAEIHGCQGCPDFKESGEDDHARQRHLLFHVMPVAGNDMWRRNCDHLIRNISIFNGRRLCGIVTQSNGEKYEYDPPSAVRSYLADHDFDFFEVPNSLSLREYVTWETLWDGIAYRADSSDIAFRCHTKGVTKPERAAVRLWTDLLYEWLLDYLPAVEASLEDHPVTGVLQKFGRHFTGTRAQWFYSGSFYWVRVRDTFALRGPSKIERRWHGVESWPGVVWPREVAGCLHDPYILHETNAYAEDQMREVIIPFFERWKQTQSGSACPNNGQIHSLNSLS